MFTNGGVGVGAVREPPLRLAAGLGAGLDGGFYLVVVGFVDGGGGGPAVLDGALGVDDDDGAVRGDVAFHAGEAGEGGEGDQTCPPGKYGSALVPDACGESSTTWRPTGTEPTRSGGKSGERAGATSSISWAAGMRLPGASFAWLPLSTMAR